MAAADLIGAYCVPNSTDRLALRAVDGSVDRDPQPDLVIETSEARAPALTAYSYFGSVEAPPRDFVMGIMPMDEQSGLEDVLVFRNGDDVWLTYQDMRFHPCQDAAEPDVLITVVEPIWTLSKEKPDSEQDLDAATCTLQESNPRAFGIEVSFYTLDAAPPVNYPTVRLVKGLGAPGPMAVSEEAETATWSFAPGEKLTTLMTHDYVEGQDAFYLAFEDTQPVLAALAKADRLSITHDSLGLIEYDVSGFAKAYADMAVTCDFSTIGVLDD